jgi:hypothetical protein
VYYIGAFATLLFLLSSKTLPRQISSTIEDIESRVKASRGRGRVSSNSIPSVTEMERVQQLFLTKGWQAEVL